MTFTDILWKALPYIIGVVVLLILILICWRRVPADRAVVITGLKKRVLAGKGGLIIPVLETTCEISLKNISIQFIMDWKSQQLLI